MCLSGKFLSCLSAIGFIGGILKLACKCFPGHSVHRVFKVIICSISCSSGAPSGMKTGSCLGVKQEVHVVWADLVFQVDVLLIVHGVHLLQLLEAH